MSMDEKTGSAVAESSSSPQKAIPSSSSSSPPASATAPAPMPKTTTTATTTPPPRRPSAARRNSGAALPSSVAPLSASASTSSCTSANVATVSNAQIQQVGQRQGMRSRSRTTRKASTSTVAPNLPRYNSEDHPLSAHKLAARGYHSFSCLGVPFHVPKRYTFLRELGIGAYGCVALARDEELDTNVAIKKVTRVFERDVLARRALREVAILRHMLKNQNCTALIDFDTTFIDFSEIYLVLSASEADLSQIIRSGQTLSDAHLQYFAAQLLRGVRHMHAANIIHRDLKPGNLLVNADCALFICDFGLARAFADAPAAGDEEQAPAQDAPAPHADGDEQHQSSSQAPQPPPAIRTSRLEFPGGPLTEYVSTRWYRAPEIMLGFRQGYGTEIDMWSVGCILAELASGKPLFDGKDYVDQIARIHSVLGPPPQTVIDRISSERARVYVESLPKQDPVPLSKILKGASAGLLDLLGKLLAWDPSERLSAADALKHPWLSAYHGIIEQWERPEPFSKFAEVELINSLQEFKGALQKEADEVKGEYEALFGGSEDGDVDAGDGDESTVDDSATPDGDGDADGEEEGDDAGHSERTSFDGSIRPAPAPRQDLQGSKPPTTKAADGAQAGTKDSLRPAPPSQTSSGSSSSGGSSSDLTRTKRHSHGLGALSSPDPYSTDTGTAASPITPSGDSLASASGEHLGKAFPSGFAMTPAGTPAADDHDDTIVGHNSTHASVIARGPRQTLNSISTDGQNEPRPRYRRRAISNAPRPQEDGVVAGAPQMPPRSPSAQDLAPSSLRRLDGGRSSSKVQHLDLKGVDQFSPSRDDAVLTPQKPSPDFRRYTTDLIPRPRTEMGAFGSPALEAGDDFATQLRRRSSGASSSRGLGDLTAIRNEAAAVAAGRSKGSSSSDTVTGSNDGQTSASRASSSRASSGSTLHGGLDGRLDGEAEGAAVQEAPQSGTHIKATAPTSGSSSSFFKTPSSVMAAATSALSSLVPGSGGGKDDKQQQQQQQQ